MQDAKVVTSGARANPERRLPADALLAYAEKYRWWLFGVLLLAYLLGFNGHWQLEPDSALYLSIGKNLALGRGYTYQGQRVIQGYPGLPLALAVIFRVFPSHALYAANVFILGCGLAVLVLTYRLVYLAYDRANAVVVTLLLGMNHELYRYCYEIMTDVPFLAGVMAFLAGYEAVFSQKQATGRKAGWLDWALLVAGLGIAVITRPTMIGLIGIAIIVTLGSAFTGRFSKRAAVACVIAVLIVIAAFVVFDPRGKTGVGSYEHWAVSVITTDFPARLHDEIPANIKDLFGLNAARSVFGMPLGPWWMNAIAGTIALACGLALWKKRAVWSLWIGLTVVILILFISTDRYMLQVIPLLTLGWWLFIRQVNLRMHSSLGNIVYALLFLFFALPNCIEMRYLIKTQHQTPFLEHYKDGRYPPFIAMAEQMAAMTNPGDPIACPTKLARIMTFVSDRDVFEEDERSQLKFPQGWFYVVYDQDDAQMREWMSSQKVVFVGKPLLVIPRTGMHSLQLLGATSQ